MSKRKEARELEIYLRGVVDGKGGPSACQLNSQLDRAASLIGKLANNMCVQGFVGCRGGDTCTSSHK